MAGLFLTVDGDTESFGGPGISKNLKKCEKF